MRCPPTLLPLLLALSACVAAPPAVVPSSWDAVDAAIAREASDPVGAAIAWRALRDDPTADATPRAFARLRLVALGHGDRLAAGDAEPVPGGDPIAYLEALAAWRDAAFVVVPDARAWPAPEHLPWVARLVDLDLPCASVHSWRDSTLDVLSDDPLVFGHDDEASTVGHEAAYLLAGARHGLYPVSHESSVDWPLDVDALAAWGRASR